MTKTSVGNPMVGVEWEYTGPVSIFKSPGFQGGISRTMFLNPKPSELKDIPKEMFMVKISQSKDPARAGQPLFRFLTLRATEEDKYSDEVPKGRGIDQNTPLQEIKDIVVDSLGDTDVQISLRINLHGTFTIVDLVDGSYDLYNEEKFPSDDIMERGEPPYYLSSDVDVTVKLKGAENLGNDYLQSRISSSTLTSDDVFRMRAQSKVWGEDDGSSAVTYGEDESSADDVW